MKTQAEPCCRRYDDEKCGICSGYYTMLDFTEYDDALVAGGATEEVRHRAWHRWWDGTTDLTQVMPCNRCPQPKCHLQLVAPPNHQIHSPHTLGDVEPNGPTNRENEVK